MKTNKNKFKKENKCVCECVCVCECARTWEYKTEWDREALYVHGKVTAVGLSPRPLSHKTVKSEIKCFTIVKQFSQIVCLLDPIQKQYSEGLYMLCVESHTVSAGLSKKISNEESKNTLEKLLYIHSYLCT